MVLVKKSMDILGENISIFRGKYTYFGLGETAFIGL
jgi:hypothetical protein